MRGKFGISLITASLLIGGSLSADILPIVGEFDKDSNGRYSAGDEIVFHLPTRVKVTDLVGDSNSTTNLIVSNGSKSFGTDANVTYYDHNVTDLNLSGIDVNVTFDNNGSDDFSDTFIIQLSSDLNITQGDVVFIQKESLTNEDGSIYDDNVSFKLFEYNETVDTTTFVDINFTTNDLNDTTLYNVFQEDNGTWVKIPLYFTDKNVTATLDDGNHTFDYSIVDENNNSTDSGILYFNDGNVTGDNPSGENYIKIVDKDDSAGCYLVAWESNLSDINESSELEYLFFNDQNATSFIESKNSETDTTTYPQKNLNLTVNFASDDDAYVLNAKLAAVVRDGVLPGEQESFEPIYKELESNITSTSFEINSTYPYVKDGQNLNIVLVKEFDDLREAVVIDQEINATQEIVKTIDVNLTQISVDVNRSDIVSIKVASENGFVDLSGILPGATLPQNVNLPIVLPSTALSNATVTAEVVNSDGIITNLFFDGANWQSEFVEINLTENAKFEIDEINVTTTDDGTSGTGDDISNATYSLQGKILLPDDLKNARVSIALAPYSEPYNWVAEPTTFDGNTSNISLNLDYKGYFVPNDENRSKFFIQVNIDNNSTDSNTTGKGGFESYYLKRTDDGNYTVVNAWGIDWKCDDVCRPNVEPITIDGKVDLGVIDIKAYKDNLFKIKGFVVVEPGFIDTNSTNTTLPGESGGVGIDAISLTDGSWHHAELGAKVESNDTAEKYEYTLELETNGSYIVQFNKWSSNDWGSYFVNFGDDHKVGGDNDSFVSDKGIEWKETNLSNGETRWLPDVNKVGYITLEDSNKSIDGVNIDFIALDANQFKLEGNVTLPKPLITGEVCEYNSQVLQGEICWIKDQETDYNGSVKFLGWNDLYIEAVDKNTGDWLGYSSLRKADNDQNTTYSFELKIGEEAKDVIFKVSEQRYFVDSKETKWNQYYISIDEDNNTKYIDAKDVQWVKLDNGRYAPDVNKTGFIPSSYFNSDKKALLELNLDTSTQFNYLYLNVIYPNDWQSGDVCKDDSGNIVVRADGCKWEDGESWVGSNKLNFEAIDVNTSNWTWIGEPTKVAGKSVIKLPDEGGNFIIRVNKEQYDKEAGYNSWSSYYLEFNSTHEAGSSVGLISEREVEWKEVNSTMWLPDLNKVGYVTFDSSYKGNIGDEPIKIDINATEQNVYKLKGTITPPSDFKTQDWDYIDLEIRDADTGEYLGWANTKIDDNGSLTYYTKLDGVKADQNITIIVNRSTPDNYESYVVDFDNSKFVDMKNIPQIEVTENNETNGSDVTYFIPNFSDYKITLGEDKEIVENFDFDEFKTSYESSKIALSGKIILPESVKLGQSDSGFYNSIGIEAIDKTTGKFLKSTWIEDGEGSEFDYVIEFVNGGDYIIKVTQDIDGKRNGYYINFGADHAVGGSDENADKFRAEERVGWVETGDSNSTDCLPGQCEIMPNPDETGWLSINAKIENYDIDLSSVSSGHIILSGSIKAESGFKVGDLCKFDGNDTIFTGDCWQAGATWVGHNDLMIDVIDKESGDWLGSTPVDRNASQTDGTYSFKLDLGEPKDSGNELIVRVAKIQDSLNDWDYKEGYLNFGDNHAVDDTFDNADNDKIVSGKKVDWVKVTATDCIPGSACETWIPNPEKTGWLSVDANNPEVSGIVVDMAALGQNEKKIQGTVTFPSDFNIANSNNWASVEIIDAKTGNWIDSSEVNSTNGFTLKVEPEGEDEYIVRVYFSHWDSTDYKNSYWKTKYVDFGSDNAFNGSNGAVDTILDESMVKWEEKEVEGQSWKAWVPKIDNPLKFTSSDSNITNGNINLNSEASNYVEISGTISKNNNDTGTFSNIKLLVVNPVDGTDKWVDLDGLGDYNVSELPKDEVYTLEVMLDYNGKPYHFFVNENNVTSADEVKWGEYNSSITWAPLGVTYYNLTDNKTGFGFTLPQINETRYDLEVKVSKLTNQKVWLNLFVPNTPIYKWKQIDTDTNGLDYNFSDLKAGNPNYNYYLTMWVDGKGEYDVNGTETTLLKNVEWVGKDDSGTQICPNPNATDELSKWDCEWQNISYWVPNVDSFAITENKVLNLNLPSMPKVSGSISGLTDLAGKTVYVNIFEIDSNGNWGSDNAWLDTTVDENGDLNFEVEVKGGKTYRIELWNWELGGFVVYNDNGDYKLMSQGKSWTQDTTNSWKWIPVSSTLISIDSNGLDLSTLELPTQSTVTITLQGVDSDEKVWIDLEGIGTNNKGEWKGTSNYNWDTNEFNNTLELKVPDGDYRVYAYPDNHNGGVGSDGDGNEVNKSITTFTKFNWQFDKADKLVVNGATSFTVNFNATSASYGGIVGEVNATTSEHLQSCANGFVEAWSATNAVSKVTEVNSSCEFIFPKLETADDYVVTYFNDDLGLKIEKTGVNVQADQNATVGLVKPNTLIDINTTISYDGTDSPEFKVALLEYNSTDFIVLDIADVNDTNESKFVKVDTQGYGADKNLSVAVAVPNIDSATGQVVMKLYDSNETVNGIDNNGSITLSVETKQSN